jgi:tetratricopeptide (TPR) repeat protein
VEIVKQGLEHNPRNPRLLMGLGHACRFAGKFEEAIEAYEESVKRGGDQFIDAYIHISNIYAKALNQEDEAQKYARKYQKAGGEENAAKRQMAILDYEE